MICFCSISADVHTILRGTTRYFVNCDCMATRCAFLPLISSKKTCLRFLRFIPVLYARLQHNMHAFVVLRNQFAMHTRQSSSSVMPLLHYASSSLRVDFTHAVFHRAATKHCHDSPSRRHMPAHLNCPLTFCTDTVTSCVITAGVDVIAIRRNIIIIIIRVTSYQTDCTTGIIDARVNLQTLAVIHANRTTDTGQLCTDHRPLTSSAGQRHARSVRSSDYKGFCKLPSGNSDTDRDRASGC